MRRFINSFRSYFNMRGKKGVVADYLPWLLIALAVLAILLIFFLVLKGEGVSLIDKIKGLVVGR